MFNLSSMPVGRRLALLTLSAVLGIKTASSSWLKLAMTCWCTPRKW